MKISPKITYMKIILRKISMKSVQNDNINPSHIISFKSDNVNKMEYHSYESKELISRNKNIRN